MRQLILKNIVLAAAVCAFAAPVWADDYMASTNAAACTPADFAWDAALINLKEIRLGQVAQNNSQNSDVQEFGKHMVRDHTRLNERLEKIAEAEGLRLPETNTFYVPVQQPPEEKQATELMMTTETPEQRMLAAQLDAQHLASLTGTDFDKAYADAMVKGHQKAMDKFQNAAATLQDDQLKKFANRGLRVIRGHYEMAQKLQAEVSTNSAAGPNM